MMRRQLSRSIQGALRIPSSEPHSQPIPYICASCRCAASNAYTSPNRSFMTSPLCLQEPKSQTIEGESSARNTHYDLFPQTFPNGPPPKAPFSPDLRQLRKEFLQAQAKAHPDLAPGSQKRHAEALSARINEAYRTLQDPLKRAQHLLALEGIDVEDDSAKLSGGTLLMEVMEAREAVDEAKNEQELAALKAQNDERIADSVRILDDAFAHSDLERATQEAVRLRYWKNIEESIQGWEKGKGGGVLHH